MTLPFRRRHHDDEGAHDRARALTSLEMLEALPADDAGWLAGHLDGCAECRKDRAAYLADRELLRSMRERTPEAPRDLWARTSAAIEREARGRGRGAGARGSAARGPRQGGWRRLPFGPMAGALIVLVVVGASIVPPLARPSEAPGGSAGDVTAIPEATQIEVTAGRVGWIRSAGNGSWELVFADVEAVCPRTRPSCRALDEDDPAQRVNLGGIPTGVTISPNYDQLLVEADGVGAAPDRIFVVPVPPTTPPATPAPTVSAPTTAPPSPATNEPATPAPATTPPATPTPATQAPVTPEPGTPAPGSPTPGSPDPSAVPDGVIEIASGVSVVGEAAYSADGKWLAFSARPSDGSTGPDLYLWSVGAPTPAVAVTNDHQTYFSAWHDGRALASRAELAAAPTASGDPAGSEGPAATDLPTSIPDATAGPSGAPAPLEAHPVSFLLDPVTLERAEIETADVWLPVVDSRGRFVVFWSGTLRSASNGLDWELGTGHIVLDHWSAGPDPAASLEPDTSPDPSAEPVPALGPTGNSMVVDTGTTAAFKAKFDPTGTRLAIWVGEQPDAAIGRLRLIVLDDSTGAIDPAVVPLPGAPALRRFSIDFGRLAWVTPSGQDGQESSVQVLGWSNDDFGEIRTIPSRDLYIVR
jgi:hypothetical protein